MIEKIMDYMRMAEMAFILGGLVAAFVAGMLSRAGIIKREARATFLYYLRQGLSAASAIKFTRATMSDIINDPKIPQVTSGAQFYTGPERVDIGGDGGSAL